jgi:hypothetical protein
MLEDAIRAFREQRLSDAEYLRRVTDIAEKVKNRTGDDIPEALAHREVAKAFFGVLQDVFAEHSNVEGVDAANGQHRRRASPSTTSFSGTVSSTGRTTPTCRTE